ncbi:hypothetical protein EV102420_21_00080 [Pseudescherichia vulneris NBRC 102420]|uniref:Uncharacterized protein n=1 Tax=Pseudescherichia vulneris NBRC 102420 TaxID=1115515 RepID=A0A090V646_PSEVU|nr:hypothetical protein EV102420_21_00080 [Pseudescherichia vulneris NBRC 102420]STQ59682.1 Uncharacterised protein [Pseudescherichia vulneris]
MIEGQSELIITIRYAERLLEFMPMSFCNLMPSNSKATNYIVNIEVFDEQTKLYGAGLYQ